MQPIDLYPFFYCLYIKDYRDEEKLFMQSAASSDSSLKRIDIFANEDILYSWIKEEQRILASKGLWGIYEIYDRLYSKKMFFHELTDLLERNKKIDSLTFVDNDGLRRLYFRNELEKNYTLLLMTDDRLYAKETIYIINRQKRLDDQVIMQKDAYFVTYPEIGTPLFSLGIKEWAYDLISRKPDQGFYIEKTSLYDIYNLTKLTSDDSSLFLLAREEAPHYILRQSNLKKIVEDLNKIP